MIHVAAEVFSRTDFSTKGNRNGKEKNMNGEFGAVTVMVTVMITVRFTIRVAVKMTDRATV